MKEEFRITYSSGVSWTTFAKSIRGAKLIAARYFDYGSQLNGINCTIYNNKNKIVATKTGTEKWKNNGEENGKH